MVQLLRWSVDGNQSQIVELREGNNNTTMGITLRSNYHCLLCQHIRKQVEQILGQAADIQGEYVTP